MPTEFTMPKLGLTMEEGTIVEWLVPDGSEVADGTPVLVVQTDKVETEVNVLGSGRLHQLADIGATLACGERVGLLLNPGEELPANGAVAPPAPAVTRGTDAPSATTTATPATTAAGSRATGRRLLASPNARRTAAEHAVDLATVRGTGPCGRIVSEDVEDAVARRATAPAPASRPEPVRNAAAGITPATFAARSLADLLGIDITTVAPDPRDGRVSREDVARHVRRLLTAPTTAVPPASQTPSSIVPLRGMRGTIARRMHASLQEMAQLTLTMDADLDAVVADRRARQVTGDAPGYTDYVIAAMAKALRDHPIVNAQVTPDGVALLPDIHVGMAVALDGGLVVPVVRDADRLGVGEVATVTSALATAARTGSLTLDQLEGGTFSVSALGMFGVDAFTPVINPPNVAILGVGRLRDDVVLRDGEAATTKRMTLSLTWDHRAFDGAPAAEFTRSVVAYLADRAARPTDPVRSADRPGRTRSL